MEDEVLGRTAAILLRHRSAREQDVRVHRGRPGQGRPAPQPADGARGRKIGNAHLKWAFSEAAAVMIRSILVWKSILPKTVREMEGAAMTG